MTRRLPDTVWFLGRGLRSFFDGTFQGAVLVIGIAKDFHHCDFTKRDDNAGGVLLVESSEEVINFDTHSLLATRDDCGEVLPGLGPESSIS